MSAGPGAMHGEPDMARWRGRVDAEEGPAGRRWHQVVQPWRAQPRGVALLGFACDAGVARNHGRVGAKDGPLALRAALSALPVRRCEALFDAGDVRCDGDALEDAQAILSETVGALLDGGLFPIVLGGGHEMALGSFGGLARHLGARVPAGAAPRIGIVNLDAHFDLRLGARASSGTPFREIAQACAQRGWPFHYCCLGVSDFANTPALFARAGALGATWRRDEDMGSAQLWETLGVLDRFIASVDHVYLTVDLDVLPAAVAPGVSAPAPRGVGLDVVEALVDRACACGRLRLADIAELNPSKDIDQHTARVAARLVGRIADAMAAPGRATP